MAGRRRVEQTYALGSIDSKWNRSELDPYEGTNQDEIGQTRTKGSRVAKAFIKLVYDRNEGNIVRDLNKKMEEEKAV